MWQECYLSDKEIHNFYNHKECYLSDKEILEVLQVTPIPTVGSRRPKPAPAPQETIVADPAQTIKNVIKSDSVEVAYRVTSKQLTKRLKAKIIMKFEEKHLDPQIIAMFKSEMGDVLVAAVMSFVLPSLTSVIGDKHQEKINKLSKELRISGETIVADNIADQLMEFIIPELNLDNLPNLT